MRFRWIIGGSRTNLLLSRPISAPEQDCGPLPQIADAQLARAERSGRDKPARSRIGHLPHSGRAV